MLKYWRKFCRWACRKRPLNTALYWRALWIWEFRLSCMHIVYTMCLKHCRLFNLLQLEEIGTDIYNFWHTLRWRLWLLNGWITPHLTLIAILQSRKYTNNQICMLYSFLCAQKFYRFQMTSKIKTLTWNFFTNFYAVHPSFQHMHIFNYNKVLITWQVTCKCIAFYYPSKL